MDEWAKRAIIGGAPVFVVALMGGSSPEVAGQAAGLGAIGGALLGWVLDLLERRVIPEHGAPLDKPLQTGR